MSEEMDVKEFGDLGYLQELNRVFLHPLGLALAWYPDPMTYDEFKVKMLKAGYQYGEDAMSNAWVGACLVGADKPRLGPVLDERDDPEGWIFDWNDVDDAMRAKTQYVSEQWEARKPGRIDQLGYLIQPLNAQVVTAEGIKKMIDDAGQPEVEG